jgi:fructose-bisphosphate aldolase class I
MATTAFKHETATDLEGVTAALLTRGKGILAADETPLTLGRRFDAVKIESTPTRRRDYRELLITTPGVADFISGVILQDETIRQASSTGTPFADLCLERGMLPGIKVDASTRPLANHPGERITEGLDGLRDRLAEYRRLGARFAKWRSVIAIAGPLPSTACIVANAEALARYASLCQEQGLVPIVEPEVLMTGNHSIERCEQVTGDVLHEVFEALREEDVRLEEMLLKPNMVVAGEDSPEPADAATVASATLRCLRRHVPAAVPGIVFLSGGQRDIDATRNLNAIARAGGSKPWVLTFSFARALQSAAITAWQGKPDRVAEAQREFHRRARSNGLATTGRYSDQDEDVA